MVNVTTRTEWVLLLLAVVTGCAPAITPSPPVPATAVPPALPATAALDAGLRIAKYPGNYTCFKIETARGVTIITDAYAMDEDVQPDIVTISHNHADHSDLSRIAGDYRLVNTVGTFEEQGITIVGVGGHHNRGDSGTTNIIYVFDFGGIRLAQFASQGEMPTDEMFAQIGTVDILVIQIYGTASGKLSVSEARDIAQRLQAKIVIPAHTDVSQNELLAALLGGEVENIPTGELAVTPADLASLQKPRVVCLDRAPRP